MNKILQQIKDEPLVKALLELAKERKRKIYLVGGFVRDALLGCRKEKLNLDFAVDSDAPALAKELAVRIGGSYVSLDDIHNIARVVRPLEGKVCEMDFADFRAEFLEGDLLLRDFTINAIALDLETMKLIDPASGQEDIKNKILRAPSEGVFIEDPARIIRAFALAAGLGFEIERETEKLLTDSVTRLSFVSGERIRDELFKVFEAKDSWRYIRKMDEIGILDVILPEIKPMKETTQGHYHHLDVWQHSIAALEELEKLISSLVRAPLQNCANFVTGRRPSSLVKELSGYLNEEMAGERRRLTTLKFAALLHDVGKPAARTVDEEGRMRFHSHENIGADILEDVASRLKLSNNETVSLKRLTRQHLRPGYLVSYDTVLKKCDMVSKRLILRIFRDSGEDGIGVFLLSLADKFATRGPLTTQETIDCHQELVFSVIEEYFTKKKEIAKPPKLLTGNDLMSEFNLPPGPKIGELLRLLEEAQVEGEIRSKEDALKFVKNHLTNLEL